MALSRTHGRLYPLVSPPDELPAGVPAPPRPADSSTQAADRGQDGRFRPGAGTKAVASKAARAKATRRQDAKAWGSSVGLGRITEFVDEAALAPHVAESEAWLKATCESVATTSGGGTLSPGCVSILRGAAWSRCYASYFADLASKRTFHWDVRERGEDGAPKVVVPRTELVLTAQRLFDSSRQALLACHELAVRESEGRKQLRSPVDFAADMRRRILGAKHE